MQKVEGEVLSSSASETPIPIEMINKRPRQKDSPSVTEVSAKEFKIHTKKIKIDSNIEFPLLEETQGTIVLSGPQSLNFDSSTIDSPSFLIPKGILAITPHIPETFTVHRLMDIFQRYKEIK